MNKQQTIWIIVLVFLGNSILAQDKSFFDVGLQWTKFDFVDGDTVNLKTKLGFTFGLTYSAALSSITDLNLGMRFSNKNSRNAELGFRFYAVEIFGGPAFKVYKGLHISPGIQYDVFRTLKYSNENFNVKKVDDSKPLFLRKFSGYLTAYYLIADVFAIQLRYSLPYKMLDKGTIAAGASYRLGLGRIKKSGSGLFSNLEEAKKNKEEVTDLILQRKGLSVFPPEIIEMSNLSYLYLNGNQLSTLPDELGKLTKLEHFFAANNKIAYLPPQIVNLKALEELDLSYNQLNNLPEEIGELVSLKFLKVNDNNLSALPQSIMKLQNLIELDVSGNAGLLRLPQAINLLRNLETLIVDEATEFPIPFSPANPRLEIIYK